MIRGAPRHGHHVLRRLVRGALMTLALVAPAGQVAALCVTQAEYDTPTGRYGHRVLGAEGEYADLVLGRDDESTLRISLPHTQVFEDIAPLVVDMDGDACAEVVTVVSSVDAGAKLAIYDATGQTIAQTPPIGRRNRWLAVIGAADLDGDGAIEVAYIDRPHLAKTLRIWRYGDSGLTQVAAAQGLTNHQIGWDYIAGGLRDCGEGPEMILASADWSRLMAVRFDGQISARDLGPYAADAAREAVDCL
ncbi:FG-GAP repeat domain-containing protein [Sagittula sp. SSi028]|uniref:FG-GAP repeat domain-containing protein n=1 Tax=Sagittula sp. SSi028 TaxID=3400636 RepID=UPI003AF646CE